MSKAQVRALRSVDLGFSDLDKALRFFTEVWHLTAVSENAGVHYLRGTGAFHHVLTLRRAPKPALFRMVLDAADVATVNALHAQVVAHGLKTIDKRDRPRKLSHVNINAGDSEATFACYRDALGFRMSDSTRKFRFLSCNADHHSMVLGFDGGATLNHIAFEMPDLDSVMRGAGRMRDDGRPIEWGPGRHGPGNNVFSYFLGCEDVPVEYTADMQQIDATYRGKPPEQWTWPPGRLDQWGISAHPSERMDAAGLNYLFTDDGWRLDEWR